MSKFKGQDYLQYFLSVYFYTIEKQLNNKLNGLKDVKFQSEEANTDEYLKKYFKQFILANNSIKNTSIKSLKIKVDKEELEINTSDLLSFEITNVFLPEELSKHQKKEIAKRKNAVYTQPDLFLEISNGDDIYYETLELKSTLKDKIPGSSVQQVTPFEWVIFVKRNTKSVDVSTGFYINSITNKLPFPDRSPRPQIGFKTLVNWNNENRTIENNTLTIISNSEVNNDKIKLLTDWQNYLASEWLEIVKANESKANEKWFNNAIRKFAVKFLEYSETLNEKEKIALKIKLNLLIKQNSQWVTKCIVNGG